MFVDLIRKDLVRRWRSPISTVVMLIFPFMMAGLIGSISGGSGDSIPLTRLLLLDREDGFLGGFLTNAGAPSDSQMQLEVEKVGEEGFERMEKGDASALLVIPENFTEDLLEGRDVTLQIVRNPTEGIKPEILEQGAHVIATYLDVAVKALGSELKQVDSLFELESAPSVMVITSFVGEFYQQMRKADRYLFPPVVKITSTKEAGKPINVFGYVLVMVSVMSVLFVAIRAVTDLYEDKRTGMLRRQMSTPVSVSAIVGAKFVFAMVFGVVVMVILLVSGALFGWFQEAVPLGWVILHTLAFTFAAAGLMTVVVALVKTEKQAGILAWIVVMVMSVLGGSMFPAEQMPASMRELAVFTLNYHAIEGYLDLIARDGTVAGVLPRTGLLALSGVVLSAIGQPLMRRRLREVV